MKIVIVIVLVVIVGSLASALHYLLKDRERSPRTVRALTVRIGLSMGLFVLLLVSFALGLIKPHGLRPGVESSPAAPGSSPAALPR